MIECPEVFQLIGADELRYETEPDESLRADVEAAADACPTQSITVDG
jgi:ferredoxin